MGFYLFKCVNDMWVTIINTNPIEINKTSKCDIKNVIYVIKVTNE